MTHMIFFNYFLHRLPKDCSHHFQKGSLFVGASFKKISGCFPYFYLKLARSWNTSYWIRWRISVYVINLLEFGEIFDIVAVCSMPTRSFSLGYLLAISYLRTLPVSAIITREFLSLRSHGFCELHERNRACFQPSKTQLGRNHSFSSFL